MSLPRRQHRTSFARPRSRRGAQETLLSRGHRPCRPRLTKPRRAGTLLHSSSIFVARLRCLLRGLIDVSSRGDDAAVGAALGAAVARPRARCRRRCGGATPDLIRAASISPRRPRTLPSRGHRPCRPRLTKPRRAGTLLHSSSISVARLRCLLRGLFDVTSRGHDAALGAALRAAFARPRDRCAAAHEAAVARPHSCCAALRASFRAAQIPLPPHRTSTRGPSPAWAVAEDQGRSAPLPSFSPDCAEPANVWRLSRAADRTRAQPAFRPRRI